jgi:trigger factor
VVVKDVKENVLPEVTDEWAGEASEFDTVEELRADIVKRSSLMKKVQASMALRNGTVDALVQLVDIDPPQPLVDAEVERQAHDLGHRLEAQGATFEDYLAATGRTQEELVAQLREASVPAVKADLALRSVADAEGLEPDDDELAGEIARLAENYQMQPGQLLLQLQRNEQLPAVRSDLRKSKALEWLVERVELVDGDGQPVDRALLDLEQDSSPDDDGTDSDQEAPVLQSSEADAAGSSDQPQVSAESGEA